MAYLRQLNDTDTWYGTGSCTIVEDLLHVYAIRSVLFHVVCVERVRDAGTRRRRAVGVQPQKVTYEPGRRRSSLVFSRIDWRQSM